MLDKRKVIKMRGFLKKENGSITVLVVSSLFIMLIVIINLFMINSGKVSSQNREVKSIQKAYNMSDSEMATLYEQKRPGSDFSRANGKIDIQFLKGTSYEAGSANKPAIDENNMVPVNWVQPASGEGYWEVTDETNWDYSYGDTDETKKWANVMLRDVLALDGMDNETVKTASIADMKGKKVTQEGSMLVWLPRYAYKITYYDESDLDKTGKPVGYSDSRGLVDSEGKTPEGMNSPVTSIGVKVGQDYYYRPHPAFEDGTNADETKAFKQGEWDKKLTGIWMGKFETTPKGADGKITILPNISSYRDQTIGTFYTEAQDLGIANSHMAKNSEWGAMAYLTESKYGRNGTEVTIDNNVSILTGGTNGYKASLDQSTTRNIYGIYDTVGGAWEYTAGYIADSSGNYGNSFASTNNMTNNKETSTKYATVYEKSTSNYYSENYTPNINKVFGDGIIETSTAGTGTTSWHSAASVFVGLVSGDNSPFFKRGGDYVNSYAGSLDFGYSNGDANGSNSFRVCLVVM